MNFLNRAIRRDGLTLGGLRVLIRLITRLVRRLNAKLHRIDGYLPVGSQVSGVRGISVGSDFQAHGPVWIEAIFDYGDDVFSPSISIGSGFRVSDRLHITAIGNVIIGDNCLLGSSVFIGDHAHGAFGEANASDPCTAPASRPLGNQGDVFIGPNCWIGDNVTIVGPVRIGHGVVIAANSVVTGDVGSMQMVAGVPARVIKAYCDSSESWVSTRR